MRPDAHGLRRGRGELVHAHEPLQRDERLDPLARALRVRHGVHVVLDAPDGALRLEGGDDRHAGLVHGQAGELAGGLGHAAVLADDGDLLQPVPPADLEVVGIVAGRDLQAAGAEVGLHVVVGDDRQAPPDEREHHLAPDEVAVAIVVRVHRDRRVGQHRLRPHRGDHHLAAAVGQRVGDRVQRVDDALAVLDLEVGDRRAQARVPVDHVGVAVDEALLVEVDEDLQDRADVALVHREALVVVVELRAEALELLDDLAAELLAPAPHGLAERLAAELLAGRALRLQALLDLPLRRDARVVGAEDPLRALPAHAVRADERVLDRAVQRVAHVQRAGDVRRRDRDREVLVRRAGGLGMVQAGLEPALDDARLDLGGLEARPGCRSLGRSCAGSAA